MFTVAATNRQDRGQSWRDLTAGRSWCLPTPPPSPSLSPADS